MGKSILRGRRRRHKSWDDMCGRCGLCCYSRSVSPSGEVAVKLSSPCVFLDRQTHMCLVYEERFKKYPHCRRVNLLRVLFNKTMPPSCAYVRKFRFWDNGN